MLNYNIDEINAELEKVTKAFIRGLMDMIRLSAIYRIRKDINFVDYDKFK